MKLKNVISVAAILLLSVTSCKKSDDVAPQVEPVVSASAGPLTTFQSNAEFYQLYVYRYDEITATWTRRIASHFSTVAASTPTTLGFTNPYVQDSGVNLFGMVTLYSDAIGTSNIKEAGINAPGVLQFFPSESTKTKGTVKIIAQDVLIKKKAGGTFKIGISGDGTYDEATKVIDLIVKFNETAIGGAAEVKRTYKLSVGALNL